MRKYRVDIKNPRTGLPVVGATVTIRFNPAGALAPFYMVNDVNSTPAPNPYVTSTGLEEFYFPDNYYDVTASYGATTTTDEDIMLADVIEISNASKAAVVLATGAAQSAADSAASITGDVDAANAAAAAAAGSATTAGNAATAASASKDAAAGSATTASNAATNAAGSASTATTAATSAGTAASNAQASATTASNAATAAGGSANTASTSATNAANSATAASTSAGAAAASAASASSSSAAVGSYPNAAASNVPRGLQSVSVTNAGTGGTNATNVAVTWTGGNMATNPGILFDVAGGAVTNVRVQPGLYIGAAPTYPTATWPGAGTGFAATLNFGFLVGTGGYYWVQSADNSKLIHYQNVGGVATLDAATGPILTTTGLTATTSGIVGGRENVFPDPFFTDYARQQRYASVPDLGYSVSNQGGTFAVEKPRAASPFPDGMQVRAGNATYANVAMNLPNIGLKPGDVIEFGVYAALNGAIPNNTGFMGYSFSEIDGVDIPGSSGITVFTSTTAYPFDATSKPWTSPAITIPAKAYRLTLYFLANLSADCYIDALWLHKLTIPGTPTDIVVIPNGRRRLADVENRAPTWNNVTLRRCTYTAKTTVLAGLGAQTASAAHNGFAQAYLSSFVPAGGFNGVEVPVQWGAASPIIFACEIRTLNASEGKHPLNGRVVARGQVGVDPTSGGGETMVFMLLDPVTGAPKTVQPADLGDRYAVCLFGTNYAGSSSFNQWQTYGDGFAHIDPAYPTAWNVAANAGGVGNLNTGHASGFNLVMLTNPVETYKTPSSEFARGLQIAGEGVPTLIGLPKKVYGVVGREMNIFWYQVQRLEPRRIGFTAGALTGGVVETERLQWVPTAAGTTNVSISSALGEGTVDTRSVAFIASPAANAAKTVAILAIGDSLIENEGVLTALNVIDQADAATTYAFLGTHGTFKNEGYSGMPLGAFFGAQLGPGRANPFYNGATFDFNTWKNRSDIQAQLTAAGKTEPDIVIIEGGKVDVGSATTDGAAIALCAGWAGSAEAIVADILAKTTNTKVAIMAASAGPWPSGQQTTYGALWRVRRNWMQLAAQQWAQFAGREANRIHVLNTGCGQDPYMGWGRIWQPRTAGIIRDAVTLPTWSGVSLAYPAGKIAFITDVGVWCVKRGASGIGYWEEAKESDGFEYVVNDPVHWVAPASIADAEAIHAFAKFLN